MKKQVYISGLYSGPSPSAGLGVARSLRQVWPDQLELVGVDFWEGSSGLQDPVFDRHLLLPSFDLADQGLLQSQIEGLANCGLYISTLDIEIAWLRHRGISSQKMLVPQQNALNLIGKPYAAIVEDLPFSVPPYITSRVTDEEIYDFCRDHSWRVWLKGPYHGATLIQSWHQLEAARSHLTADWRSENLSLQANVQGHEESLCFAAYDGELIDAVYMKKRLTTPDGKTWAGKINSVPVFMEQSLRRALAKINYTGGGELELIRDPDGKLWFMEWNPRFPAWIYGASLTGRNLPAQLVRRATGEPFAILPPTGQGSEFTRVVTEIPVGGKIPLPVYPEVTHGQVFTGSKYGAGMATAVGQIESSVPSKPNEALQKYQGSIHGQDRTFLISYEDETPKRVFLAHAAAAAFAKFQKTFSEPAVKIQGAYSIKTAPDAEMLLLARKSGLLAEAISQKEVAWALENGFKLSEVVLNGPGKWWPEGMDAFDGLRAVFCDSMAEFSRLVASPRQDLLWGVRLRLPSIASRFGVDLSTPDEFDRAVELIRQIPPEINFGVHFHLASNLIGNGHWKDALASACHFARALSEASGRPIHTFDMGGGYHPRDVFRFPWHQIRSFLIQQMPTVREILIEPGRAMSQSNMAVITRVLDIQRDRQGIGDVVVDACIAELPLAKVYPHPLFVIRNEELLAVQKGASRILGRICMEDDILFQGIQLPEDLKIGDRLVIGEAGAYERSMSYEFGRG